MIGPNNFPLQQHIYAQEFDEFGNPINVTDFSPESVNGAFEQTLVDEFGNPLNVTDFPTDSINGTGEQQQLNRSVLQGLAQQFGSTQVQSGNDSSFSTGNITDGQQQQPFEDEFGNGTGFFPSGNITDGQQQQEFVDEFGNVVPPGSGTPPGASVPGQQQSFVPGQQGQSFLPTGEVCDPNAETLEFTSTGPLVVRVQNLLIERGFNPGVVDGIYGANTVAAVEQFQRENGLIIDGKTGPQTWDALCRTSPLVQSVPPTDSTTFPTTTTLEQCDPNAETIRFLSEGPLVTRLQNLLIERGFNPGVVDGIFGEVTLGAVQQFQGVNGLTVDGIVGPQTWDALCKTPPIVQQIPPADESPPLHQIQEICGDFLDNDFNGQIDENCPSSPPITPANVCDPSGGEGNDVLSLDGAEQPSVECLPPLTSDPICPVSNTPEQFQTYNKGFWKFEFGIKNQEGLFLRNIFVKNNHVLDRLSLTHLSVDAPGLASPFIVRFCEDTDAHEVKPLINSIDPARGIDAIKWDFTKSIKDSTGDILGTLTVEYDVVIRFEPVSVNCEFGGAPCVRLIPKVKYTWRSDQFLTPREIQAFYRLDFGKSDPRGRGLVPFDGTPASVGFERFQAQERVFTAVKRDPNDNSKSIQGEVDNFHDILADVGVHVPGCRPNFFNCFHMHFRWNSPTPGILTDDPTAGGDPLIDVLVEPSDDRKIDPSIAGTPYLVSGQQIDVGIAKFDPNEQQFFLPGNPCPLCIQLRPNADPLALSKNPERIAIGATVNPGTVSERISDKKLRIGDHILLYYVASSLKSSDVLFRHGIYSLDTTNAKLGPLSVPNCGESPFPGPFFLTRQCP